MSPETKAILDQVTSPEHVQNLIVLTDVDAELTAARKGHKPMNSLHEAYAVIHEELDEVWDITKLKESKRDPAALRAELVQVAAMACRAIIDLGL